jgi:hypothetical protein
MVYQERSQIILMITHEEEKGRVIIRLENNFFTIFLIKYQFYLKKDKMCQILAR